jgi:protocatechuate 3,4-dioxygenase beta subunit
MAVSSSTSQETAATAVNTGMMTSLFSRRRVLAGLATVAASPVFAADRPGACRLTPQTVEGPFYVDPALVREDITEGRPGVALRLALQVVDANGCRPVEGARVDVWHADAAGWYSGHDGQGDGRDVSTRGQTFLRGTQFADAGGGVAFATLYPGWYAGRTPHIHFKVFLDHASVLTGQLYFPDALSEFIYREVAAYGRGGRTRDTSNRTDGVLAGSGGGFDSFCSIREDATGYLASLVIGIDPAARPAGGQRGGPPPGQPPEGPPPEGPPPRRAMRPPGSLVPGVK